MSISKYFNIFKIKDKCEQDANVNVNVDINIDKITNVNNITKEYANVYNSNYVTNDVADLGDINCGPSRPILKVGI